MSQEKVSTTQATPFDDHEYPSTRKAAVIICSLYVSIFLVALDRLIIGIAIPAITNEFGSLDDVGWYGSAFLLPAAAFCLLTGRLYTLLNVKYLFMASILLFEIGSAICGAAPNSVTLIVGRAIAGLGSAGMMQGSFNILMPIVPLHKRPVIIGLFGAVFGLASVLGPILGGAFTDGPGWRWCFYINLPLGGLTLVILAYFLKLPEPAQKESWGNWKEIFFRLDIIGTSLFLPSIISIVLALQWGGVTYAWSNWRTILLLCLFTVLLLAFIVAQWLQGDKATVPGRIFMNRNILAGTFFTFCNYGAMMAFIYFLSIWFQAIKGSTAVHAGIQQLPMILGLMGASIPAGILTKKIGYFNPFMILSSVITPIGMGLITSWDKDTGHAKWIGYQVIVGFGIGLAMQAPALAAQTALSKKDVPIGTALVMFGQTFGGTIFISVANNLFNSRLVARLSTIPGLDPQIIVSSGASELRTLVSPELLPIVLDRYNDALRGPFYVATGLSAATILGSLAMQWMSVKPPTVKKASSTISHEDEVVEAEDKV